MQENINLFQATENLDGLRISSQAVRMLKLMFKGWYGPIFVRFHHSFCIAFKTQKFDLRFDLQGYYKYY